MSVVANTISTNTYFFQSAMGDKFNPNSEGRNDIVSMPFLFNRQTANDINIGGFQVVAGGYKDENAGNTNQGWSGVKVPVAGIYMASFNMVMNNDGSWGTDRFRNACMFTVTNDNTFGAGIQVEDPAPGSGINLFNPVKSAMCYIRNAGDHTISSNIQTRLLRLNQGAIVGLACEALGGNLGTTHIIGERSLFSLSKLF